MPKIVNDVTYERASAKYSYDASTGEFTFISGKLKGRKAGCLDALGYWRVQFDGRPYLAHRVAWLLHYGEWPAGILDHANRVRSDNRIANLREATNSENSMNCPVNPTNSTGYRGVWFCKKSQRFRAEVIYRGKKHYFGVSHKTAEAANEAIVAGRKELFGNFAP